MSACASLSNFGHSLKLNLRLVLEQPSAQPPIPYLLCFYCHCRELKNFRNLNNLERIPFGACFPFALACLLKAGEAKDRGYQVQDASNPVYVNLVRSWTFVEGKINPMNVNDIVTFLKLNPSLHKYTISLYCIYDGMDNYKDLPPHVQQSSSLF